MRVELPDGAWASIRSRDEITERQYRVIDRARTRTVNLSARLLGQGYVADVTTLPEEEREAAALKNVLLVTSFTDEDQATMEDYQLALIVGLTESWSYGEVSNDTILDLAKPVFEQLAKACQDEMEGVVVDLSAQDKDNPLAPGASSDG